LRAVLAAGRRVPVPARFAFFLAAFLAMGDCLVSA
jgi:hypothetical protein